MKSTNSRCFVLKSTNYGDSDKIFTLLSENKGKISAVAKGVRKISSKRRGNLDTLNLVDVKISENSGGYKYIQEVKIINSYPEIKKDVNRTFYALYIAEFLNRTLDEDGDSEEIFNLFGKALKMLSSKKVPGPIAVAYFETHSLKLLGYQITLDKCVKCEKNFDGSWENPSFNLFPSGLVCESCTGGDIKITTETANVLNSLDLDKFSFKLDKKTVDEIEHIMRIYIDEVLGEKFKTLEISV